MAAQDLPQGPFLRQMLLRIGASVLFCSLLAGLQGLAALLQSAPRSALSPSSLGHLAPPTLLLALARGWPLGVLVGWLWYRLELDRESGPALAAVGRGAPRAPLWLALGLSLAGPWLALEAAPAARRRLADTMLRATALGLSGLPHVHSQDLGRHLYGIGTEEGFALAHPLDETRTLTLQARIESTEGDALRLREARMQLQQQDLRLELHLPEAQLHLDGSHGLGLQGLSTHGLLQRGDGRAWLLLSGRAGHFLWLPAAALLHHSRGPRWGRLDPLWRGAIPGFVVLLGALLAWRWGWQSARAPWQGLLAGLAWLLPVVALSLPSPLHRTSHS